MKKKSIILTTMLSSLLPITSVISISCNNPNSDSKTENSGFQINFLKEPASKNQIIQQLLDVYLNIFYENDLKDISGNNNDEKILKAIGDTNSNLHKDLYDVFKQYAAKKLEENPQIFWNLKFDFIRLDIDATNFNPSPKEIPKPEDFIFIMKNSKPLQLNWRLEIEKLLISKLYLLKSREEFKKLSNNDKGQDKYQVSLDAEMKKDETSSTKKDIYNALDLSSSNLYLIKHLVENPIIQKWSFTDNQDMNLRNGQANVSKFEDFNNLASYTSSDKVQYNYNPVAKHPEFIIATGSSENAKLDELRAFKGIEQNTNTSGNLANTLDAIKNTKSPIFGFVNPNTNQVWDQDYFKFANILESQKELPKIKPTNQLNGKIGKEEELKNSDAKDIEFDSLERDSKNEKLFTKEISINGNGKYTLLYEINGDLVFSGENLRVPMRLSVKGLGKRHFYDFNAILNYDGTKFEADTKANKINLDKFPKQINMIKNGTIDAAYVVKIAPMYILKEVDDEKEPGKKVNKGFLTFDQTPWNDEKEQSKIANHIIVSKGNELFREANKYILDNLGFKLVDLHPIVLDIFKAEGIL